MVWVGRELEDHPVASPCHGQGAASTRAGWSEPHPAWSGTHSRDGAIRSLPCCLKLANVIVLCYVNVEMRDCKSQTPSLVFNRTRRISAAQPCPQSLSPSAFSPSAPQPPALHPRSQLPDPQLPPLIFHPSILSP